MKRWKKSRGERGQSLTEFAVGVIFILVLLASGMDFGRAYFSYISIRDAAQEGAAYASIAPSDVTCILSRVRDTSANPIDMSGFSDDQINIVVSGSACAGNTVSVTVEYDFNIVAPFVAGNTLELEAEAIDTILQPPC